MTAVQKLPNWPRLLAEFVNSRAEEPFAWGRHDCALFAADAVRAMTGADLGAWFRGRYSTGVDALRSLVEFCGATSRPLERTIERIMWESGAVEVRPEEVGRGDVALIASPGLTGFSESVGVAVDDRVAVPAIAAGVAFISIQAVRRAWRI